MTTSGSTVSKPTCFIISPIGKDGSDARKAADQVLKHLIRKALGEEYVIKRGDEDSNPGSITSQIVQSILEADLVVADLSGYNPNVYYEVAVAHGYDRPVIHIQKADEAPAFDLKDMRLIRYNLQDLDEVEKAQKALREFAAFLKREPKSAKTPLADAQGFVQIATSEDPVAQSNAEVIEQLRSLRTEVRRAVRGSSSRTTGQTAISNVASLRRILEKANNRGALASADFDSSITPTTTASFDRWARKMLSQITGEEDVASLNEILFNAEVANAYYPEPDEEPEVGEG
ncbi:hypothetical protein JOE37_002907 [Clavibacter michiganensis]|nr:hypothetical protein [Clavibacter michiganensis]